MLYEAKVLDSRQQDEKDNHSWQFKIHYKGWKNTVRTPVTFAVLSFSDLGPIWASSSKVGKSEVHGGHHFNVETARRSSDGNPLHFTNLIPPKFPSPRFRNSSVQIWAKCLVT
jgi:hypothetical protein